MTLDVEAARAAVQTIADAMGLDSAEQAAEGILAIVNENMAGALRLVSVQRGHDPRDFALVAYGGAGPLHANAVAKIMGSFPVIVPPAPGLLCAIGDLVADFRDEFAQTYIRAARRRRAAPRSPRSSTALGDARARRGSTARASPRTRAAITYSADMRYHRQGYEIPVALDPDEVRGDGLADLEERFNGLHEQLYGFRMPGTRERDRQPARRRVRRRAEAGAAGRATAAGADASGAVVDEHEVVFDGERVPTKIYDRAKLEPGATLRRARRSSPSSTRRRSSCPATGPRSTSNFNILITPNDVSEGDDGSHRRAADRRDPATSRSTRSRSTSSRAR